MSRLLLLAVAGGALLGCATPQEGRLYRTDVGLVSRFRIADAASRSTDVQAELAGGITCSGRAARTDASDTALSVDGEPSDSSDAALGVLVCSSGVVLRCRLVHRATDSYAYGQCTDQTGSKYTVIF